MKCSKCGHDEAEQGEGLREAVKDVYEDIMLNEDTEYDDAESVAVKLGEILVAHPTPDKAVEPLAGNHTCFSDRLRLESKYIAWAKDNGAAVCPSSVLCWAQSKGLLNTKAARAYLEGLEDKEGV